MFGLGSEASQIAKQKEKLEEKRSFMSCFLGSISIYRTHVRFETFLQGLGVKGGRGVGRGRGKL